MRLVFTDGSYNCGYYDVPENILYDCNGVILLNKPKGIILTIPDSSCCRLADFDGDGVKDTADRCIWEKGPASNYGCPVMDPNVGVSVHLPGLRNVYFTTGSSSLSDSAIEGLKTSVKMLKEWPRLCVSLDAHTDDIGNYELNKKISMTRIKVVRSYLVSAGIDKGRISYILFGSKYPIADNRTAAGRTMNRRVELTLYY